MALLVSFAVVGWASWYRFVSSAPVSNLVAIQNHEMTQSYYDDLVAKFTDASASSSPAEADPTTTDLVSRQFISDYISLAQSGQVNADNLVVLGDKYADSLAHLTQASTITFKDLKIVENTPENLRDYMVKLSHIYQDHASTFTKNTDNSIASNLSKNDYGFMEKMAAAYTEQASGLKALPVPAALAQAHIKLVNANLLNAAAFEAASQVNKDPAVALAGIITVNQNAEAESLILNQMIGDQLVPQPLDLSFEENAIGVCLRRARITDGDDRQRDRTTFGSDLAMLRCRR